MRCHITGAVAHGLLRPRIALKRAFKLLCRMQRIPFRLQNRSVLNPVPLLLRKSPKPPTLPFPLAVPLRDTGRLIPTRLRRPT